MYNAQAAHAPHPLPLGIAYLREHAGTPHHSLVFSSEAPKGRASKAPEVDTRVTHINLGDLNPRLDPPDFQFILTDSRRK